MTHANAPVVLACHAILFDLDGVLVNSAACIEGLLTAWALRHALRPTDVIHVAHGRRTAETVRSVAPHLDADAEASALTAAEAVTTLGIVEVPGAKTVIRALSSGRWAIVTSGARAVARFRLEATGLPEPGVLICAEDVIRGKPDPEGYLAAARRLGVATDTCIVVEDAPAGVAAARAAGMRSIGVVGTYPAGALADATHVIASLADLQVLGGPQRGTLMVLLAPA